MNKKRKGKIISFAWTTEALKAGAKSVTRRDWKPRHAMSLKEGDICQAWNKVPYCGGKFICYIQLTEDPYLENTIDMPDDDYEKEGFFYMYQNQYKIPANTPEIWTPEGFNEWKKSRQDLYVIRFKIYEMED